MQRDTHAQYNDDVTDQSYQYHVYGINILLMVSISCLWYQYLVNGINILLMVSISC